jgi:hypothetical protein
MDVYTMVVVIVIVSCIAGVANRLISMKQKQSVQEGPENLVQDRLTQLENRIQVLEKIVTDDRRVLEQEIDSL